jgi:hypothetical protein
MLTMTTIGTMMISHKSTIIIQRRPSTATTTILSLRLDFTYNRRNSITIQCQPNITAMVEHMATLDTGDLIVTAMTIDSNGLNQAIA